MATLRTRRRIRIVLALAALAAGVALLLARPAPQTHPPDFAASPPLPSLPRAALPFDLPEELHYEFGWNGIPAATLRISTRAETAGAGLVVEYEVRSLPALESLWSLEATGRTLLDPATLRPQSAVSRKRSGDRDKTCETAFDWQAGLAQVTIRKVRDGETKHKTASLEVGLDMPSAFVALRAAGAGQSVRVISGDSAYQVVLLDRGRGPLELSGETVEALHYEVGIRELDGEGDGQAGGEPKSKSAHVWLTPGMRTPLRLEAPVDVGHVYAALVRQAPTRAD